MGLFSAVFGNTKPKKKMVGPWQTMTAYRPTFYSTGAELYEQEQLRAAINAVATHISKLRFEMHGEAQPTTRTRLMKEPNPWMTWSQYLYRLATNEDVLQNKAIGDKWSAFYEGPIEAFAIQASDVHTRMIYSPLERGYGNAVMFTANRLQYMTNKEKLEFVAQMGDRGMMTRNELREVLNLPPLPEPYGSQIPTRGEYYAINEESGGDEKNA